MDKAIPARQNYLNAGDHSMKKSTFAARSYVAAAALLVLLGLVVVTQVGVALRRASAQGASSSSATTGSGDLAGTVKSANGAEAGVWVIAETTDTPTRTTKIVVTDDQGRFLIPDLPKGNYQVWVRGYGLVDSPKVQASPARRSN